MPLEKLNGFTKKVQDLADKPNATMSAAEVKAQFDAAPDEVRQYLNKLIDDLSSVVDGDSGADNVGATAIAGLNGATVQAILESLKALDDTNRAYLLEQIQGVTLGQIPDGTVTPIKLSAEAKQASNISTSGGSNVQSEIDGLKSSGNNGKNQLETTIIVKEGTVNKAGMVATFNELDLGIQSIPTSAPISGEQTITGVLQGAINKFDAVYLQTLQTKLANPASLPIGTVWSESFSPDGNYLAVAHGGTPFVSIYKRSGDVFTKLANPDVLPTSTPNGVSFSPDNTYLTVAHATSPFITIYKRNGDAFTKLPNPSVLPTGTGFGISFSQDNVYMSIAHDVTPFLSIYKRSGDTFTKLANPTTLPTATVTGVSFSTDGNYLACSINATPFVMFYKRSGDTFTKLADPAILPPSGTNAISFSTDNNYVAINHTTTPFVSIYKRNGDVFTKLANPDVLPPNNSRGISFSPDTNYLAVTSDATPFLLTYKRSGDLFTKIQNPSPLPPSLSTGVAFSLDGNYMAIGHNTTPFFSVYKKSTNVYKSSNLLSESVEGFGYAKETGTTGESKQIGLVWR